MAVHEFLLRLPTLGINVIVKQGAGIQRLVDVEQFPLIHMQYISGIVALVVMPEGVERQRIAVIVLERGLHEGEHALCVTRYLLLAWMGTRYKEQCHKQGKHRSNQCLHVLSIL